VLQEALGHVTEFPKSLPDWSYMLHGLATSLPGSSRFDVQFLSNVTVPGVTRQKKYL
jgi:hypothetical protein